MNLKEIIYKCYINVILLKKKSNVGGIIMTLELEILDDKYKDKDLSRINAVIKTGRTYWKS